MNCFALAAIGIHIASLHAPAHNPKGRTYNDANPGAYVVTECGLTAGAYLNSYDRATFNLGYHFEPRKLPVFIEAGLATGYPGRAVTPYVYSGLRLGPVRVGVIPHIPGLNNTTVVHAALQFKL